MRQGAVILLLLLPLTGLAAAEDEAEWVKRHAVPFATVEAGNGFADLEPLRQMIGKTRIVSLGESTHGSREIFQMKHRMVEFLATEMGFTIFSIEASMPESYRVNDYVLNGKGDPKKLIRGMYFWTWSTDEVLAMVEWMRAFNAAGKGRIEFTGFDMQTPNVAASIVNDHVQAEHPEEVPFFRERYEKIIKARTAAARQFGSCGGTFPIEAARGKR